MHDNWIFQLDFVAQCTVPVLGITAGMMVACKKKWGFVIGLASQPFWITTAIINHQWGSLVSAVFFVFVWAFGIYKWFSKDKPKL